MAERSLKDLSATFAVVICLNDLIYRLELVCNTNRALVKQTTTPKGNIVEATLRIFLHRLRLERN